MTAVPTPGIRLVVCGNTDRGDDGLALLAATSLVPALRAAVRAAVDVRRRAELRVEDLLDRESDPIIGEFFGGEG